MRKGFLEHLALELSMKNEWDIDNPLYWVGSVNSNEVLGFSDVLGLITPPKELWKGIRSSWIYASKYNLDIMCLLKAYNKS